MMSVLDCSFGEGGGSIVRIAVALAAAMDAPLRLTNIRAKRSNPGLRSQHVESINAIALFSGIKVTNLRVGSSTIELSPSFQRKNKGMIHIATAGSIALVAQAVLYYSMFQENDLELTINGGATHGKWAPSIEYAEEVLHKLLSQIGKKVELKINKYGFYPKGGANVSLMFRGHKELYPLELIERGDIKKIEVFSVASKTLQQRRVAERQIKSFLKTAIPPIDVIKHIIYVNSTCPGTGLTVVTHYENKSVKGCFTPGEKKLSSERVGELCAKQWMMFNKSKAALDHFATDQLIIPLSIIQGKSVITTNRLTNHTKTNIYLAEKFTNAKIKVEKEGKEVKLTIVNNKIK
ncbi:MAG: RNA 3'-terminal phosphate cyclase [Candidatus Heimdallarchaeaceae archaeon]